MMTFGSLFAGIGGFDLGLERAGMKCLWQVEINPYCQRVLAKHWPDVERFADVRECGKHNLPAVDLICGGFPCQPHSTAGKRRGAADDRNLWPEFIRIIKELQPRWVLGENVPGIRTTMLDTVLSDLETEGYTCGTFNIPACAFDAPHRRERIFVVANATSSGFQPEQQADERGRKCQAMGRGQQPRRDGGNGNVADATITRLSECATGEQQYALYAVGGCDAESGRAQQWQVEPNVGRVADGVPHRVDRLRALGNAVVPQVVEWIGQRIMEIA